MKKVSVFLLTLYSCVCFSQNEKKVDSVAVRLLDKMSAVIGDLSSVSYDLNTSSDELNDFFENERLFNIHEVIMVGPDKMTTHSRGDKGNRATWYNGDYLSYYSFDENNYVTIEAPDNIITMIDSMHSTFDFKFPAADLFYPTLTDDILNYFDTVAYLGLKEVEGQECFHVMASSKTMTFQLWISNNALFLPKKYLFIDKEKSYQQHEGTFNNWIINTIYPDDIFNFVPPKNAKLISIMAKS